MAAPKRSRWGHIQTIVAGEKYRIFWPEGHKPDGKRNTPSKTIYGTWADADLALAVKRIELTGLDSTVTWREFWLSKVVPTFGDLAARTRSDYLKVWAKHLDPRIGDALVAETNYSFACSVLGSINAPSAQRYAMRLWKKICNMACHEQVLAYNPIDRTIRLKPRNKRRKHELDASECMPYLVQVSAGPYLPLVVMETVGGLRHEEAVAVCAESVRRVGAYAEVEVASAVTSVDHVPVYKSTKNAFSERAVLFAEPFATLLLRIADGVEGPLFPGKSPEGDEPNATWFANPALLTARWSRWCEANGVRYIRPADMRSIYSDWQAEAGTPDSLASLAMGHAPMGTRGQNYQRRTRRGMQFAADSLAEYLIESAPCAALWAGEPRSIA